MVWQDFLRSEGAQFDTEQVCRFAGPAAAGGTALLALSHFGLLRFTGEDTAAFLQGQLSSDVRQLRADSAQYSSYSTPKGRMLASLLLIGDGEDRLLMLPQGLLPAIQKRLSMYVLRSKTRVSDISEQCVLLGLLGPQAAALAAGLGVVPGGPLQRVSFEGGWLLTLGADRVLLGLASEAAPAIWQSLRDAGAQPADADAWTLADIGAGIPWVLPATQEEFVPQMANMELIGAVSFKKGCYPGQEIVARTQYLGKLKRRCFRVEADVALPVGTAVYSADMNGQPSGQIALSAARADGRWEALAVIQLASVDQALHLGSLEGPVLRLLELPYAVRE